MVGVLVPLSKGMVRLNWRWFHRMHHNPLSHWHMIIGLLSPMLWEDKGLLEIRDVE